MSNIDNIDGSVTLSGKIFRNEEDNDSTKLTISKEFAKELQIENYRVSMSIIVDPEDNGHLLVTEFQR
jgi:hypothetical protein